MVENWQPIAGHLHYEVSDLGRVRSLDRTLSLQNRWGSISTRAFRGVVLKPTKFPNGYLGVYLGRGSRCELVHRLVARAFVGGYSPELDVNHLNGVRGDNRHVNLEWATRSANVQHSYDVLGRKKHKLTTPVTVGGVGYESMFAASLAIGRSVGSVASAIHKRHKVCGMEAHIGSPRA